MKDLAHIQESTSSVPGLGAELDDRLAAYSQAASGAFARNTERALRADLAIYSAWCIEHDCAACPATPQTVAQFVETMASTRKVSTIRRYLASIAHLHRAAGVATPTTSPIVQLKVRSVARAAAERAKQASLPVKDQAEGLTQRDVDRIAATIGTTLRDLRDIALMLVGRDILARRSELVALAVGDVAFNDDGSGIATVRMSKTDAAGEGADCYLASESVAALQRWLTAAGITSGPIFRSMRKGGSITSRALAPGEVPLILKSRASAAKLDVERTARISGHSLRVGMAQDLIAFGVDLPGVMQAGRWRSPTMPAAYGRKLRAARGAVAAYHRGRQP